MFNDKGDNSSQLGFSLFLLYDLEFFRVGRVKGHLIKSPLRKRFLQKNTTTFFFLCPRWLQEEAVGLISIKGGLSESRGETL